MEQVSPGAAAPTTRAGVVTTDAGVVVRASLVHGERRQDAVLPAGVAVAELLPGILRRLGLLGPDVVHARLRLVTADGRVLRREPTLLAQGVRDGAVLTVTTDADADPRRRYDDIVEAVADAVEDDVSPWSPSDSARTAVAAACALLVIAGAVLLQSDLSAVAAAAVAGGTALLALASAAVLDRSGVAPVAARAVGVVGCVLAALAGYLGLDGARVPAWGAGSATALAAAGGAGLVAAGLLGATTKRVRITAVAPGLACVVALLLGGTTLAWGDGIAQVATVVAFALLACASLLVPWLSIAATPLRVVSPLEDAQILADVPPLDPQAVRGQALAGHELVVALRIGAGIAMVGLTPMVAAGGWAGLALVLTAWSAIALGVRESASRADVAAGLGSAAAGVLAAVVTVTLLLPSWRTPMLVSMLVAGFAVVLLGLLGGASRTRLDRAADALRIVMLAAVPPLAVIAAGGLA